MLSGGCKAHTQRGPAGPRLYIHVIKLIIMITSLVEKAVALFVETLELEHTDINTESHKWHHLYSQECKLFDLMRQMGEGELAEYRQRVRAIKPEDGE